VDTEWKESVKEWSVGGLPQQNAGDVELKQIVVLRINSNPFLIFLEHHNRLLIDVYMEA
jgi:hypothetical protein